MMIEISKITAPEIKKAVFADLERLTILKPNKIISNKPRTKSTKQMIETINI